MPHLRATKQFTIAGQTVEPGQVIDLDSFDLPAGRALRLVEQRYGEWVAGTTTVPAAPTPLQERVACASCDRTFASPHALTIHTARAHRAEPEE